MWSGTDPLPPPLPATTCMSRSRSELAKVLTQSVHKDLYKGSTKTSGLTADVVRNGPLAATASGNYLYVTIQIGTRKGPYPIGPQRPVQGINQNQWPDCGCGPERTPCRHRFRQLPVCHD